MGLSWWHILLVLLVFVLLFGTGKISGLMGDLAEFVRKFDYRYAHEAMGDEKKSWHRALETIVGRAGIFGPERRQSGSVDSHQAFVTVRDSGRPRCRCPSGTTLNATRRSAARYAHAASRRPGDVAPR